MRVKVSRAAASNPPAAAAAPLASITDSGIALLAACRPVPPYLAFVLAAGAAADGAGVYFAVGAARCAHSGVDHAGRLH